MKTWYVFTKVGGGSVRPVEILTNDEMSVVLPHRELRPRVSLDFAYFPEEYQAWHHARTIARAKHARAQRAMENAAAAIAKADYALKELAAKNPG